MSTPPLAPDPAVRAHVEAHRAAFVAGLSDWLRIPSISADPGRAFEREVLLTREGGSGPPADLEGILEAPVVLLGVGLPDDRIHAPDEKADIEFLLRGAEAAAYLWSDLAETWRR